MTVLWGLAPLMMLPSNRHSAHRPSLQKHELMESGMSSLLHVCSLVASVVHGQRPAKTMLYPVEAEHDVHDHKSSRHPSIGLSFYCAYCASFQKAKCPKSPFGYQSSCFFPDGATTCPPLGDYPGPSFGHPTGDQTSMLRAICRGLSEGSKITLRDFEAERVSKCQESN
jgi:hypothetical protein